VYFIEVATKTGFTSVYFIEVATQTGFAT
jgi:hypothetical protein